jgi:hypothetical protein
MDLNRVFERQSDKGNLVATFQNRDGSTIQIKHVTIDDFSYINENYVLDTISISGIPKFIDRLDPLKKEEKNGREHRI